MKTETPVPEAKTRKRRNAVEMFADQKKEHADNVTAIEAKIQALTADLEAAKAAEAEFIAKAKAAMGF